MNKVIFFAIEGIRTFTRTSFWNIFSIFFLTIFILFGSIIFEARGMISNYVNSVGSEVKIELFLTDSISDVQLSSLIKNLNSSGEYDSLRYISKDKALDIFKESFVNLDLPNSINPLPQSIILYPNTYTIESNQVYSNIDKLMSNNNVEIVNFNKELLDKLAGIKKITDIVTLIILLTLTLFGVIIYYTSVYHSLNYKYEYLEVVDYFYSPKFWTSFPFYVESIIIAILSSLLFIFSYYLFNIYIVDVYFINFSILNIDFTNLNFWNNLWQVVIVQIIIAVFISILSTFLSLRSYK